MPQLQAGYAIEEVIRFLSDTQLHNPIPASQVRAMLHHLSWFEVESSIRFDGPGIEHDDEALWTVAANLVSRGLPTRAPVSIAKAILSAYWPGGAHFCKEQMSKGVLAFALVPPAKPDLWAQWLWRALHPIDPRLGADAHFLNQLQSWESHGSDYERRFLTKILPAVDGSYLMQIVQAQTSLRNLLEWAPDDAEQLHKLLQNNPEDFTDQSVDFTLPLPYPWQRNNIATSPLTRGFVLEVDGSQHWEDDTQRRKDSARDKATRDAGWQPVRLRTTEFSQPEKPLASLQEAIQQHEYFQQLRTNFERSLLATSAGQSALGLTLGPLGVARIHRTLLECMLNGILSAHKPTWRIVVIERDLPCAVLGVASLVEQMTQLYTLQGLQRQLPKIELHVQSAAEFPPLIIPGQLGFTVQEIAFGATIRDEYDLLLDVSILQRLGFTQAPVLDRTPCLTIRTAHAPQQARRFRTAPLIKYSPIVERDGNSESSYILPIEERPRAAALKYFVRNIFRKMGLRKGQLPIISRGLQAKSVLGLLPTGGGKSLTYQIAALLQPGVALVVDPIKSLMLDQFDGLHDNWIDAASFVNGSVRSRVQRELRLARLGRGELLFFFISPERMVIPEFRQKLHNMHRAEPRVGFSYCVIDEAHCVSEWGHDFRTPYLRLGANARLHCLTYEGESTPIPLYGLTATASFDVLADVQRELGLEHEDEAIVRTEVSARQELHVRILPITVDDPLAFDAAGPAKHQTILELLPRIPQDLIELNGLPAIRPEDGEALTVRKVPDLDTETFYLPDLDRYEHAGLIFCPHKSPKISSGVRNVVYSLNEPGQKLPHLKTGYFMGGTTDDGDASEQTQQREVAAMDRMQTEFKANKLNLLVATKAFGMGIDKPNVRYTIHMCYPGSIESFVQEAGRAGRDRATAVNYVLYYKEDFEIQQNFLANAFKGKHKEECIMRELLTRITFPTAEQCEALNDELEAAFPDLTVTANLYAPPKQSIPSYLYLNQEHGIGYGRIHFANTQDLRGDFKNKHESIPSLQAQAVVNWTINYLLTELPDDSRTSQAALVRALSGRSASASTPGILPRLEEVKYGRAPEPLTLGFANGTLREMSEAANTFNIELPVTLLRKAAAFANTSGKFLANLQKEYSKSYGITLRIPPDLRELIKELLPQIRQEEDTFKAVHRLCLLGVLRDYTIDYGSRATTLYFAPRQKTDQLLETYGKYLLRYTTQPSVDARLESVRQAATSVPILEACLTDLLEFTYTETAAKRQESISAMANACEMGLNGENLSEYFDLYFNSKYARNEHLPKDTDKGKIFNQMLLWRYIDYLRNPPDNLGKEKDNAKHLRGACRRLLDDRTYSANGLVLLLSGFTTLFLELTKPDDRQSDRVLEEARGHLLAGFRAFQQQDNLNTTTLLEFAREFAVESGRYDLRAAAYINTHITAQLELELLTRWLQEFNHRFDNRPTSVVLA
ncbi:DEAD/DEAH box helicase [Hymenobacter guriensis]|uniref:DEAD/DEAH box helicase n=1 Tax=Hymenobacter guriensis TaxID=2793065 RepID=A0ABS0L1J7_9BACT|nr:DEAD/DEAH box helicase [Hymenobacter guriensis]MBG8553986.1 DEAD/DEAH box helicase [Hymenobacter guriensis]